MFPAIMGACCCLQFIQVANFIGGHGDPFLVVALARACVLAVVGCAVWLCFFHGVAMIVAFSNICQGWWAKKSRHTPGHQGQPKQMLCGACLPGVMLGVKGDANQFR